MFPSHGKARLQQLCILGVQNTPIIVRQGYWSYIKGAKDTKLDPTNPNYSKWKQEVRFVMYFLETCVHDHMISYITCIETPKEVWENLKEIFMASTMERKLQFRQELKILCQRKMLSRTKLSKSKNCATHSTSST